MDDESLRLVIAVVHGGPGEPRHERRLEGVHLPVRDDVQRLGQVRLGPGQVATVLGELGKEVTAHRGHELVADCAVRLGGVPESRFEGVEVAVLTHP